METPEQKYESDPEFNNLVDKIEELIGQAHFTPSEIRCAAMLATIHFEMRRTRPLNPFYCSPNILPGKLEKEIEKGKP